MAKLRKRPNQPEPPRHRYNLRSKVKASSRKGPKQSHPRPRNAPKQEASTCVICLDSEGRMTSVKCGHRFHSKCINSWLKESDSCPVCRFRLRKPNYSFFCIMTSLIVQTPSLAWNIGRVGEDDA